MEITGLVSAKTIALSDLKSTLKNTSRLTASSRHSEDVKNAEWRCLQNEDGVENTFGTTNCSFSLFCVVELAVS